jgi:hypothetical protein
MTSPGETMSVDVPIQARASIEVEAVTAESTSNLDMQAQPPPRVIVNSEAQQPLNLWQLCAFL